jgi:hypothetical protein
MEIILTIISACLISIYELIYKIHILCSARLDNGIIIGHRL